MPASATPTLDSAVSLPDGRTLAYAEWGDPDGVPVVLLHGSPGSRLMCPDSEATVRAGVRLITFDRPGYGRSDPVVGRDLLDFVPDLAYLADHLGIDTCPVIGWSGGGPFAVACGRAAANRFDRVGLVSSPGPELLMPVEDSRLTDRARDLQSRIGIGDQSVIDEVRALYGFYADNPLALLESALASEDNPDRHVLLRPDVTEAFRTMWTEGGRQGAEGLVVDWRATALGWGFPLSEVGVRVEVWHGDADRIVPITHGYYLAQELPDAVLSVYPGEGHSIASTHWEEMLAAVT